MGPEVPTRFLCSGPIQRRRFQEPTAAHQARSRSEALLPSDTLPFKHRSADLLAPGARVIATCGRRHNLEGNLLRHRPTLAEEERRALHCHRLPGDPRVAQRIRPGPIEHPIHKVIYHGVGEGIDHLIEHVRVFNKADGARCLRRPEVLPSLPAGIERPRTELVKSLEKERELTLGVVNDSVVMVA